MQKEKIQKNYYGEIDFWRLVFSLIILVFHSTEVFAGNAAFRLFPAGSLGVDFFLLVSGYFMMASALRAEQTHRNSENHSISRESFAFLLKKIKGLMPAYWICAVLSLGIWAYVYCQDSWDGAANFIKNASMTVWNLLALNGSGIKYVGYDGATWYISSMLFAMLLLYPLCRKAREFYTYLFVPAIVFFLLGYMSQVNGSLRGPSKYLELHLTAGTCRAILEIALGSWIYLASKKIGRLPLTRLSRWLLAILELGCFLGAIGIMQMNTGGNGQLDFVVLLGLMLGLIVAFSGQSPVSRLFQSKKWRIAGEYSLTLYLCQIGMRNLMIHFNRSWQLPYPEITARYVGSCLVLALVLTGLSRGVQRLWSRRGETVRALFLEKIES